ncbi:replication fork protection component Swi3-domain-containing protein [Apodospora peruviana]|uniref:Chromosome segregation in meiosis protein n=1 Tax=Apodospora peruviana TaxID=516989 RepID=A0AAE0IU10_9PEZI|nr:replication fork protection component Swi3-domain-containing protein [Apodospora peruviana]
MPAKTTAPSQNNDINDYLADWDDDDPFRSPSPQPPAGAAAGAKNDKKRKEADSLGIDEQIDLKKKPRVPRVKLDETRLLSEKGIPKLRKMAPKLKLKGKGHEFSDAARLLSFYQEWLDDLFPKATFLDALAMVEKTGHKVVVRNERLKWIDELKPRPARDDDDDDDLFGGRGYSAPRQPSRVAPIFEKTAAAAAAARPKTPDLFGDDDEDDNIYDATPRRRPGTTVAGGADVPDDDDLDALMAEVETGGPQEKETNNRKTIPNFGSIFGGGGISSARQPAVQVSTEPDDDDLDALMAEAEGQSAPARAPGGSILGDGGSKSSEKQPSQPAQEDDDDLDALMAESEAQTTGPKKVSAPVPGSDAGNGNIKEAGKAPEVDEDDLDALMAEAEGQAPAPTTASSPKQTGMEQEKEKTFEEDEEAMAEMDGLW